MLPPSKACPKITLCDRAKAKFNILEHHQGHSDSEANGRMRTFQSLFKATKERRLIVQGDRSFIFAKNLEKWCCWLRFF